MTHLIDYVNGLPGIIQGLVGSALFALLSWLVQKAVRKAKASGRIFFRQYATLDMLRHVLHRYYVNANDLERSSFGATIAIMWAFRWLMGGLLITTFFVGVGSMLKGNWLIVASSWFSFNCFLEAFNWVKDSSADKHISHVPDDIKKDIMAKLVPGSEQLKIEDKKSGT